MEIPLRRLGRTLIELADHTLVLIDAHSREIFGTKSIVPELQTAGTARRWGGALNQGIIYAKTMFGTLGGRH
jgi:hypothetical protein